MSSTELQSFRALRSTVRERGTARVWVFAIGLFSWAALAVATAGLNAPPVGTLVPLVLLAAAFEGVFALHTGVERIGRYLAVFYDDPWERAALAFGRPKGAISLDALFTLVFLVAAIVNLEPLLVTGVTTPELTFVGGAHALFVLRLVSARLASARQRAIDSERFQQIKTNT
jgi:hypothetical protein